MASIQKLEVYAIEHNVPIMETDGIEYLTNYIREHNIKNILEIGSAIGYSAIKMALISKDIFVTTIERDLPRYQEAIKNIHDFHLENQITIINDDAFNVNLTDNYDLIFIDAAKSQYIRFFERFETNLKINGVIISDNLKFHGLVDSDITTLSANLRGIVRKLRGYIEFLNNKDNFTTEFVNIADGISISTKNK